MGRKLDKHTCMKCGRLVSVKSRYARVVLREHICRPDADLTFPQLATLKELSEPNGNPENEWRMARRGPLAACRTLERFGFAKSFPEEGHNIFAITDSGRKLLARIPEWSSTG